MIVESMSWDEIFAVYEKERNEILQKCIYEIGARRKLYSRYVSNLREDRLVHFKSIELKSRAGHEYTVVPFCVERKACKRNGPVFYSFMHYLLRQGIHVIIDSQPHPYMPVTYALFIPHFFQRYRERFLDDISLGATDTIKKYLNANQGVTFKNVESEKYPGCIYCAVNDGIALGLRIDDHHVVFKTFITYDMLKGSQNDIASELVDSLDMVNGLLDEINTLC